MDYRFKDREHLVRLAGLLLAGVVAFVVLRGLMVPKGFGELGHYRTGALADNAARPAAFAGRGACLECHTDVGPKLKGGKHSRIGCEACHGALAAHAADPSKATPILPEPKKLCPVCHQKNIAKPAKFPQVEARTHGDGEACNSCHAPHDPGSAPEPAPAKAAAAATTATTATTAATATTAEPAAPAKPAAKESAK
jgi:hypothetical protein